MNLRLYDAHNHLQDDRLAPCREAVLAAVQHENVVKMVVNGSGEEDWPAVLELARQYPQVIPSFGYHPWYVKERSPDWQQALLRHLDAVPSAVGEVGLDRWVKDYDLEQQRQVFVWQLRLAAERNLPVSIHCLQAWARYWTSFALSHARVVAFCCTRTAGRPSWWRRWPGWAPTSLCQATSRMSARRASARRFDKCPPTGS